MKESHNRPGRPPLVAGEIMRPVSTRLSATVHERLLTMSNQRGESVHALLREAVTHYIGKGDNGQAKW